MKKTILFAAVLLAAQAQIVETPVPGDPVATDSGRVAGKILQSGVKAWLGIPFAAPPVREFRWREPQPVQPWKGVYNADRKMPECIQVLRPHNINHYFGEEPTSEDCLYLNVWAPASARAGSNLPVIVFIYGGGSTIGSSGMALYDGATVAQRGAVFVNFNYRVGAFGFLAHPALTAESPHHQSGNYAYLDQVAALQWIHRNITLFGGDPSKVVISGQSAGAGSVSLLQASPLAKGLFRGAVAMSGGVWGTGGEVPNIETAQKTGLQVQQALKKTSLADLRHAPADRILALQEEFQVGATGGSIRIGGAILDGYFLPATPAKIFAAHQQNDVPSSWALPMTKVRTTCGRRRTWRNTRQPPSSSTAKTRKRFSNSIQRPRTPKPSRWAGPPRAKGWSAAACGIGPPCRRSMGRPQCACSCSRAFIPTFRAW